MHTGETHPTAMLLRTISTSVVSRVRTSSSLQAVRFVTRKAPGRTALLLARLERHTRVTDGRHGREGFKEKRGGAGRVRSELARGQDTRRRGAGNLANERGESRSRREEPWRKTVASAQGETNVNLSAQRECGAARRWVGLQAKGYGQGDDAWTVTIAGPRASPWSQRAQIRSNASAGAATRPRPRASASAAVRLVS